MTEAELMRLIRHAVTITGKCTLWRNNTGFASKEKVKYGLGVGSADLVGFTHPDGRFFALEIKTPKGRVDPDQKLWIDYVNKQGGYAAIVRSVEEALESLRCALRTNPSTP